MPDPRAATTITVITSRHPINKRYVLQSDGTLTKTAVAVITRGVAQSHIVKTHEDMVVVLTEVANSDNKCIVPGRWHGDDGTPFEIYSKRKLATILGVAEDAVPWGIVEHEGRRVAARLEAGIDSSSWFLLDADSPLGMPTEWAAMDLDERLAAWELFVPGISKACGVGLRSSSARVRKVGAPAHDWTHLWLRGDDPARIPLLRVHCEIEMVRHGWSFQSPKRSRTDGSVVGYATRGLFDTSVLHTGRIVFNARPDISAAPGFVCDAADIGIIEGAPVLDTSFAKMPDTGALRDYREKTGVGLNIVISKAGAISTINRGLLTLDTEIEVKGVVKPLRDWIGGTKA